MSRLPIVAGDLGGWGSILNDYLSQSLDATGGVTATGSTTSRTLPTRFTDIRNVKDFGAVGDNIADDTAAIQAALNKAGLVYVPPGTYKCTATLTFPTGAPTIFFGDGIGNTLLQFTQNNGTDCISISGAANNIYHEIRDMQINGTVTNLAAGNGININGAANGIPVTLRHVYVSNFRTVGKAGLNLTSSFNALFDSFIVTDSYYGVHLTLSNANIFTSLNSSSNVYGVYVESNSNSNIFAGGEIANGPTLIYCNGFYNEFNLYVENGGTTVQGVANAFGPTIQFDTASYFNRLGTKTSHDEKIQDKGLGNVITPAGGAQRGNVGALQFAAPGLTILSSVTNKFFDSSFATGVQFGGGGGGLAVTQDTTTGYFDSNSAKLAYDGTAGSNGLVSTSTQTFAGLTGDLWAVTFWIKASRDLADNETARMYWNNDTDAVVVNQMFIKGLKSGAWTPFTLALLSPLAANKTLSLRFQHNSPTGAFTAINYNLDDFMVQQYVIGANGMASGPVGFAYVQNNSTGASRTITSQPYSPKATIDTVNCTVITPTGLPSITPPIFLSTAAGGPELNFAANLLILTGGTAGVHFNNQSNSVVTFAVDNTGVVTLTGYGAGTGVVSVGAADSGGAGFKLLRVPN